MVQAIQVLRFHLLELEKVSEWTFAISQIVYYLLYDMYLKSIPLLQRYLFNFNID